MKRGWILAIVVAIIAAVTIKAVQSEKSSQILSPLSSLEAYLEIQKPLLKYSFSSLAKKEYQGSEIKLGRILNVQPAFKSYLFSYLSEGKKVTGMANLPVGGGKFPVIVMIRGYVDDKIYQTGMGTQKAADFFAQNGFLTLAPDFLGFGGSDQPDKDILISRFEKPMSVLNLLSSVKSLPQADLGNIFLWGHSNGGQIVISVLEISGKSLPTSLWAPVTRGFPESVLNYSAQLDDNGKMVAERIASFEKEYDPKDFSVSQYFDKINAPIQVHLGIWDEYIKKEWLDEFVTKLKGLGKEIDYFTYPKNNHQLSRDWETVIQKDLEFFKKNLK